MEALDDLFAMGEEATALGILERALVGPWPRIRERSAQVLGDALLVDSDRARRDLLAAAGDPDRRVRGAASEALTSLGRQSTEGAEAREAPDE
jgi:hypothetical protein